MNRVADPINSRIVSDHNVLGIDEDDFKVLVGGILVDPVRVQHTEIGGGATSTLLSNTSQISNKLKLVDTLILGLSVDNTLGVGPLSSTSSDGNSIDNVTLNKERKYFKIHREKMCISDVIYLLGLETKLVGLVRARGAVDSGNLVVLAVLPGTNTKQKAHHIALLLPPDFL